MYRTLTNNWRDEINKFHMLQHGDRGKVDFLFPPRTGAEAQPGSNAWAISGARSATGRPILANDPHLDLAIPSTWYMVHLRAPGLDVTGVSLPGAPAVIIGHNQRIAWGLTNLQFDVQDLYREQFDQQSGRYVFHGQVVQARPERNAIAVKGAKPVVFDQWVTRHGPVFLNDEKQNYALRWTAADASSFQYPFLDIDRARNWAEFTAALARFPGPGQNFVYADVDGNIGYHATGRLPIRAPNCAGDVPADGALGDCEWQGVIPFDDLPQFYNPASGMIGLQISCRREFRAALSLARHSADAPKPRKMAAGRYARGAKGRVFGFRGFSGGANRSRVGLDEESNDKRSKRRRRRLAAPQLDRPDGEENRRADDRPVDVRRAS
jgi:penicillin amidase